MSILQCFICAIPNGIHQGWIPASAGMTEGFAVFAQARRQESSPFIGSVKRKIDAYTATLYLCNP
ncbi:MAG: hypothetical protein RBS43_10585 [Candidatus Cloacimonas sp.]|nr:hypothetical protein [Candidatus Cloacimonas sp.]